MTASDWRIGRPESADIHRVGAVEQPQGHPHHGARQERGEDQHTLGMDRAAKFHLALDVDHFALAHAHGGGDAHGMSERALAEHDHGETVDLADMAARGADQQLATQDFLLIALANPLVAMASRRQCHFDMRPVD